MTRRRFLALMAGLALLPRVAFAQNGAKTAKEDAPDTPVLDVIVATDLHYIARELTDNGAFFTQLAENGDGKVMLYSEELIDAFTRQVIRRKPDVLILTGDLTFNGERVSHERLAEKLARVAESGIRVLVIPGNHDLNMRIAARYEGNGYELIPSVTADEFRAIYGAFGYDAALSQDAHSLSYTAQLSPGLRALFVDVNGVAKPGSVPQETLAWIDEQLKDAKQSGARVIAASHQNLLNHNALLYIGFTIDNAGALVSRFEKAGVLLNLSGHIHMQHIVAGALPDIATSSLAVSPNQYGVLSVYADRIEYQTEPLDVSAWAAANGLTDENLLGFSAYSARFFREIALRQSLASIAQDENPEQLADFTARVNAAYFAGRMDLIELDRDLLARWGAQSAFFSLYLDALVKEGQRDMTKLRIDL